MNKISTTYTKLFYVNITVVNRSNRTSGFIEKLNWSGLRFEIVTKYKWYFEYRAALLKVKYPRAEVNLIIEKYEPDTRSDLEKVYKRCKDMYIFKKGRVTMIEKKLELAEKHWNQLFPIDEDALYQKALEKLKLTKRAADEYLNEMSEIVYKMKQENYDNLEKSRGKYPN